MTTRAATSPPELCRPLSAPRPSSAPTLGPQVVRWIEANCVLGEGDHFGEPVRLRRWQKALLYVLYELTPTGRRRYTRALFEMPKVQREDAAGRVRRAVRAGRTWQGVADYPGRRGELRAGRPAVRRHED